MPAPPRNTPDQVIPLRPVVFEILLLLNEVERHGYGIMQDVGRRTNGRFLLGPGTLYRTLNEMQDQGLIERSRRRPAPDEDDERRVYYRLTPWGRSVAAAEAQRMEHLVRTARDGDLLSGGKARS